MAHVIVVTSGKGGTGKSSVTVGLASVLAASGKKTVILELDIGLRCVDIMLGLENSVVFDLGDVVSGRCTLSDAVLTAERRGVLDYVPAPESVAEGFDFGEVMQCIRRLRRQYDYIIVDTPAGLGISILSVKELADTALIVATPDPVCIRDGAKVATLAEQYGFLNYRLIINRVSKQMFKKSPVRDLDDVIDGVGAQLIGVLPEDREYRLALSQGEWVPPEHLMHRIFGAIADRIEGKYIPLLIENL